jgi:ABC-type transport system involved in Fe-S cluster assembly fused permease/ATPase subunit
VLCWVWMSWRDWRSLVALSYLWLIISSLLEGILLLVVVSLRDSSFFGGVSLCSLVVLFYFFSFFRELGSGRVYFWYLFNVLNFLLYFFFVFIFIYIIFAIKKNRMKFKKNLHSQLKMYLYLVSDISQIKLIIFFTEKMNLDSLPSNNDAISCCS